MDISTAQPLFRADVYTQDGVIAAFIVHAAHVQEARHRVCCIVDEDEALRVNCRNAVIFVETSPVFGRERRLKETASGRWR